MSLTSLAVGALVVVLLTAVSGFFSSSELAVFSVARHRVELLVEEGRPGAVELARLRDDPHGFLVTALVSNNVANIAAASVATAVLVGHLPAGQAATAATAGTSFFVIVFGEIAPKSYAVANAEKHALRVSRAVLVVQRVLYPVLVVFEVVSGAVNELTGGESSYESVLTREEIETLVLSGEDTGVLDTGEGGMIRRVLDLERRTARGVMRPRRETAFVSVDASHEDALEIAGRESAQHLIAYGENRDDVRGVLDVREILRAREQGIPLEDVVAPAYLVPGVKPLDELLAEMQASGYDLAVVVDEHGTVVGAASFGDVVEEVVGEFFDVTEQDPVRVLDEATAVVDGRATTAYVTERLGVELPSGPYETMGGLVNHHAGKLADAGYRVELGDVTVTVLDASQRRIRRVRVEWTQPEETSQNSE